VLDREPLEGDVYGMTQASPGLTPTPSPESDWAVVAIEKGVFASETGSLIEEGGRDNVREGRACV